MSVSPAWSHPVPARFRGLLRFGLIAAALVLVDGVSSYHAVAQGSSGGSVVPPASVDVKNKSISGGTPVKTVAPAAEPKSSKKRKPRRQRNADTAEVESKKPAGKPCRYITGEWNSWASGLFGKSDTTFRSDGTATHRSGIPGKWWCESGKLFIQWGGEFFQEFTLSDDRKQIVGPTGGVAFGR